MGVRWLITGGCGFIGTNLIRSLLNSNQANQIVVLDDLSTGTRSDLKTVCDFAEVSADKHGLESNDTDVSLVVGSILDEQLLCSTMKDVDIVVHLAANTGVGPSVENPRVDCLTNVIGTFNVLEAARFNAVSRFIFASSGAPVGEVEPPIHEELAPHPVSPYGASKLAGEGYCSAYYKSFGLETVALRFGNVYGPGSVHKASVVAKFIKRALDGLPLEIYGDGSQTRDFIFIDDLVEAITLAAVTPDVGGNVFQIATNHETTVSQITHLLIEILQKRNIKDIQLVMAEQRTGDVKRNYSDTSKAKRLLGWQASHTLQTGLEKTVDFFFSVT